MSGAPKWVSKRLGQDYSITKVKEIVAETKRLWMVETEGWRGRVIVKKDGEGDVKSWSREPRYL